MVISDVVKYLDLSRAKSPIKGFDQCPPQNQQELSQFAARLISPRIWVNTSMRRTPASFHLYLLISNLWTPEVVFHITRFSTKRISASPDRHNIYYHIRQFLFKKKFHLRYFYASDQINNSRIFVFRKFVTEKNA